MHPRFENNIVRIGETFDLVFLTRKRADDLHAHHIFLQAIRHLPHRLIYDEKQFADLRAETGRHKDEGNHRQKRDARQIRILREHGIDHANGKHHELHEVRNGAS